MSGFPAKLSKRYDGEIKGDNYGDLLFLGMETEYNSGVIRKQSLMLDVQDATELLKVLKKFCIEARANPEKSNVHHLRR